MYLQHDMQGYLKAWLTLSLAYVSYMDWRCFLCRVSLPLAVPLDCVAAGLVLLQLLVVTVTVVVLPELVFDNKVVQVCTPNSPPPSVGVLGMLTDTLFATDDLLDPNDVVVVIHIACPGWVTPVEGDPTPTPLWCKLLFAAAAAAFRLIVWFFFRIIVPFRTNMDMTMVYSVPFTAHVYEDNHRSMTDYTASKSLP